DASAGSSMEPRSGPIASFTTERSSTCLGFAHGWRAPKRASASQVADPRSPDTIYCLLMPTPTAARCENCGADLPRNSGQSIQCRFCGRVYPASPSPAQAAAAALARDMQMAAQAAVQVAQAVSAPARTVARSLLFGCGFVILAIGVVLGVLAYIGSNATSL